MRVVFMGTPDFSVGTLEAIVRAGHEVAGVFTQPDKPKGRGKAMQATPVKEAAEKYGLTVYQPRRIREPEAVEKMRALSPEVIVVVAFGQIIPQEILDMPKYGCINVHASLLPKYRGAAPIQWAVLNGEEKSGVTIMRMDAGLDTGDMLAKAEVVLDREETAGSLFDKLSSCGASLLAETLPTLENQTAVYEKQPEESPTDYARMITKQDGRINWCSSAVKLERLVRGMSPWPSAYTSLNGKTLKVWKASVSELSGKGVPGEILAADASGIHVQTQEGILCIMELQLEGKKRMEADVFLRGNPLKAGIKLG